MVAFGCDQLNRIGLFVRRNTSTMSKLEVDVALLEKIIREFKADDNIHVTDVNYKTVGAKGDNYTSEVKRILISYTVTSIEGDVHKEVSLFMKHMHKHENEEINKLCHMAYQHEMSFMMGPLKRMNGTMSTTYTPRLFHFSLGDPLFAIMEDLTPLGFTMASRLTGLDLPHSLLAVCGLAEFHASSVAVCEKMPEYAKQFEPMAFKDPNGGVYHFFRNGLNSLAAAVLKWEELGPKYSKKLENLASHIFEKCNSAYGQRDNEFTVLTHGDCSQLNMMFAHDAENNPQKVALVDFQGSHWSSPILDLLNLISCSMIQDVYQNHQQTLLQKYHSVLSENMMKLHCKTQIPSLECIQKMYDERIFITVLSSCTVYPIIHAPPSEVLSLDNIIFQTAEENCRYGNKDIKELLITRLIDFESRGLLDI